MAIIDYALGQIKIKARGRVYTFSLPADLPAAALQWWVESKLKSIGGVK